MRGVIYSQIISYEKNGFNGDICYVPRHHLSDQATYRTNESLRSLHVFHDSTIPNWALGAAPHHAVLRRTLENLVELLR
jgi:hypothetical protein